MPLYPLKSIRRAFFAMALFLFMLLSGAVQARDNRPIMSTNSVMEANGTPSYGLDVDLPNHSMMPVSSQQMAVTTDGSPALSQSMLPQGVQYALSAAQGTHSPGYSFTSSSERVQAHNTAHGITTVFTAGAMTYKVGDDNLRFVLLDVGYASSPETIVPSAVVNASQNRLDIQHGTLTEWYINGSLGVQQGFTLNERPTAGSGEVQLRMALEGTLSATLNGDTLTLSDAAGDVHLTYGGLLAYDARGTDLPAHFLLSDRTLTIAVDDAGAVYPLTIDPLAQQAYLKASNTEGGDQFGYSIDMSGNTIVVGAIQEDSNAPGVNGNQSNNSVVNAGAAYVFTRSGSIWTQQAYLKASNTDGGDQFGYSVSISGNTIVVGAFAESSNATVVNGNQADNSALNAGAAYVFTRSGTAWTQQAYLKASNTDGFDHFGASVEISADTIVVGAYGERSNATVVNGNQGDNSLINAGAAYVFTRSGTVWTQQAYLKASNPDTGDFFGSSAGISADTIIIGAKAEGSSATGINGNQADNSAANSGAVYVFTRSGIAWTQQAYLKASNNEAGDFFSYSISISGDTIVVGASSDDSSATGVNGNQADNSAAQAGAAYVFTRSGSTWTQQAYLKASNTGAGDLFGVSVAVSGDMIVVGAFGEASSATGANGNQADNSVLGAGAAYMFTRSGTTWTQQSYLKASNTKAGDAFGNTVALSGDTIVVVAILEPSNATGVNGNQANSGALNSGAAYVFVNTQAITLAFDLASSSAAEASGLGPILRVTTDDGNVTAVSATVTVSVIGGTATAADYALTGTVTIPAGTANNALVSIASGLTVTNDSVVEPDETLGLMLSAPVGAVLGVQTTDLHTILNDDTATVNITATVAAAEPVTNGQLTVTLSQTNNMGAPITVNYTVTGTATSGPDYTILTGSVVIPVGASTATIDVLPSDDTLLEGPETVIVTLTSTSHASVTIVAPVSDTVTITDDDTATVNISATVAAAEPATSGQFTVTLSQINTSGAPITVNYTVTGTATSGPDYTTLTGSVNIPNGASTATIDVLPSDDPLLESLETVIVTLTSTSNAGVTVAPPVSDTVTIADDDTATVNISATVAAAEPATNGRFIITMSETNSTGAAITVNYTVTGTATSSSDYTTLTGSVNILNGASTAIIDVIPTNDAVFESSETVVVTLTTTSHASVTVTAPVSDTVAIADDDAITVSISANDAAVAEPADSGQFTITMSQINVTGAPITVNYSVTGTAASTTDYTALSGFVSIPDGASTATLDITPVDDLVAEGSETIIVTLTSTNSPSVTVAAPVSDTVTIADDDIAGITVTPIIGLVTTEAGSTATFTVVLTTQPTSSVTISVASSDTSEGVTDFATLTFGTNTGPGGWDTPQTVTITGQDDAVADNSIPYMIILTMGAADATYGVIDPTDVSVTNTDNETSGITVAPTSVTIAEGGATATFTVSANTAPANDVTVTITTDAQCSVDLPIITLPAGSTAAQTVTVTAIDDTVVENNHTCVITTADSVSVDLAYSGLIVSDVTAAVEDNEAAFSIASNQATVAEGTISGSTFTFTVTRTGGSQLAASVDLTYSGATETTDFTFTSVSAGTLTGATHTLAFPANTTTMTITYTTVANAITQADRPLTITLNTPVANGTGTGSLITATGTTTITDDDASGVTVTPISGLFTTESGGTATFTVVLNIQPTATVIINVVSSLPTEGIAAPTVLMFGTNTGSGGWDTPQTVTITGQDDAIQDGPVPYIIQLTMDVSNTDATYLAIDPSDVSVTNTDNDTPGVTIAPTSSTIVEGGSTTYTVVLNTLPTASVTVTLSTGSPETTISPTILTFSTVNGKLPQTVTLTVAQNSVVDGIRTATITHDIASVADAAYDALVDLTYTLTITDDDAPPVVTTPVPETDMDVTAIPGATALLRLSGISVLAVGDVGVARMGDTVTWTYTVENISGRDLSQVNVRITFPDDDMVGLQANSSIGINGTFRKGSLLTDYALGMLRTGQSETLTIVTRLPNRAATFLGTLTALVDSVSQPESATLSLLGVGQLPATGERPLWRGGIVIFMLVGVLGLALLMTFSRRSHLYH